MILQAALTTPKGDHMVAELIKILNGHVEP